VLVVAILLVKFSDNSKIENNNESTEEFVNNKNTSVATNHEYITYLFYIKDDGGRLTVYDVKTAEIFMQTGIETNSLSPDLQEKVSTGIFFENETALYDFLESYSS